MMKPPEKVLLIIRRSLGDVLAISPVVDILHRRFSDVSIDLLVNKDTVPAACLLDGINKIIPFDDNLLQNKTLPAVVMQIKLIGEIFRKYDLAIAFTTNERSNVYAYLAGRTSVGMMEPNRLKNWWHRILLDEGYRFNHKSHILENNLEALHILGITIERILLSASYSGKARQRVQEMLNAFTVGPFIIFHPTGRFLCKSYPPKNRNILLHLLDSLDVPIIVTGGKSEIDLKFASEIPALKKVHSLIGKISLEECAALTDMSLAYVGVDTFNCHLASAFNKPMFVMLGPTIPEIWSPWSNALQTAGSRSQTVQTYGCITLFQSSIECAPCGHSKCGDSDRYSLCMDDIDPYTVFDAVKRRLSELKPENHEDAKTT
jgi:heptosyltransferase-3